MPSATLSTGKIETSGPLLITHGLGGAPPEKFSQARDLEKVDYHFTLEINWTGNATPESLTNLFEQQRQQHGARKIVKRLPDRGPLPVVCGNALSSPVESAKKPNGQPSPARRVNLSSSNSLRLVSR